MNSASGMASSTGRRAVRSSNAQQSRIAHFRRENAHRCGKWSTEADRLIERCYDTAQASDPGAPGEIFERLAAIGQDPHFRGGYRKLLGHGWVRGAEIFADPRSEER